jgi:hypothetical protein
MMGEEGNVEREQGLALGRWMPAWWELRHSLIAGGIVFGLVVACVIAWVVFSSLGVVGDEDASRGVRSLWTGSGEAAQPVERAVGAEMEEAGAPPAPQSAGANDTGSVQVEERLIVRTGNITMAVGDTRAAKSTIEAMVAEMAGQGAFVVSSQEYGAGEEGSPTIQISLRVPATRFDEAMDRLAALAERVTNRSESADDVTEEYVDLEARLESLEAARQRLLGIMEEARSTKDLLEAEQQLTQREAEIESLKGRKQYLEQSARLSSIWVELQPYILSQPVGDRWRPAESVRRAFESLVDGLRGFGDFVIFFAIAVLPWLVLLALVAFVVVRLVIWRSRARRRRRAAAGEPPGATS